MSDLSDSGGSGLSDWALVNNQGELEGSDVDSNTSSIEVVGRETEVEEDGGHDEMASRESSPECIELEQLMKTAETAARGRDSSEKENAGEETMGGFESQRQEEICRRAVLPLPHRQSAIETVGACSLELLQTAGKKRERAGETGGTKGTTLASQVSHGGDPSASSDSVLSVSAMSSVSSTSRSNRTDSDSESDFVRLEKESSYVSTESEGEEPQSRTNPMITSGSSVGSGFNFLHSTRALQQPPSPQRKQAPPQPVLEAPHMAHPPVEDVEAVQAREDQGFAAQEQEAMPAQEDGGAGCLPEERVNEQEGLHGDEAVDDQEEEMVAAQGEDIDEEEEDDQPEELQARPDQERPAVAGAAAEEEEEEAEDEDVLQNEAEDVDDDAETESSTEDGDQDDRIESEQSDDSHSAPPDGLDQVDLSVVNDIGDLPVGRVSVKRQYIHYSNQQLNGRLNRVVLAVLVLALGMGLGHWIGSTREHFSQLEIQLSQMKRLHQMQDEYMQCLARNDELLVDADIILQNERERHQEAIADLRDNNRELQEQLQDAQERLEQLLTASARVPRASQRHSSPGSFARDLQYALTLSKLLMTSEDQFQTNLASWDLESQQQLLQARESFSQAMEEKHSKQHNHLEKRLQLEIEEEKRLNLKLQVAYQHLNERLNFLEVENADLKVTVGKMRYKASSQSGESVPPVVKPGSSMSREHLPPPPRPLPPPPFAAMGEVQNAVEQDAHKEVGSNRKGTLANQAAKLGTWGASEMDYDDILHGSPGTREEAEAEDLASQSGDFSLECGFESSLVGESGEEAAEELVQESDEEEWNGEETDGSDKEADESGKGAAEELVVEKRQENPGVRVSSGKSDCSSGEVPRPIPVDVTLLQRNLTQERQRAEMWRHLYLWEREEKRGMNASACLQYLTRGINMSGLMQLVDSWNMTGMGMEGITDLTSLVTSIARLHQHLLQSLPALWQDLSANLHDLHSDLSQQGSPHPPDGGQAAREPEGKGKGSTEDPPHSQWSDGVKTLLNKTRGTLSNVSRHLQQTWDQVKDVSSHLWPSNNSVFGRMAAHVQNSVSQLSHKVRGKAVHWFKKRSKSDRHGWRKSSSEDGPEEEETERSKERSSQQTVDKEDMKAFQKRSHSLNSNSDTGRKWKHHGQDSVDKRHNKHEDDKRNVSSQKHERSDHKRNEHFNEPDHRNSHGNESRKDKQFSKHRHEDSDRKNSKKGMSDKHYHNDSGGKYYKRSHHYRNHHGDSQVKDKQENNHRQKHYHFKKIKDQKYNREDSGARKAENQRKERKIRDEENVNKHWQSDNQESQFSIKAKHHSSHAEKTAGKIKHKIEKQFHNLFVKIGAMSRQSFLAMDWDDVEDMREDMEEVSEMYSNSEQHLGLPHSGCRWLQCQVLFWRKAERQRVLYDPKEECMQYLAPWQIRFILELRERVERGECSRVLTGPYMSRDGLEKDAEGFYEYECSDDRKHEVHDDDDDDDDGDDDDFRKPMKHEPQTSPKGQREGDQTEIKYGSQGAWNLGKTKENKRVNLSDIDSRAWYFFWVEGRNNLRSEEHKADWLFERASERDKTREQERRADWMFERASERGKVREQNHRADWVFERAAYRDAHHDDDEEEEDEEEDVATEERKDNHGRWHGKRTWKKHGHHKKDNRPHRRRRHHWHEDTEGYFKHKEKDYQPRHGRTVF